MSDRTLISESNTLDEFNERLKAFRISLLGRCPADADGNSHYLAWCDGVEFGRKHTLRLTNLKVP